jgi:carbon-monoxide dehydrogenase medium subunit
LKLSTYIKATSIKNLLELINDNPSAKLLAGGTDILVHLNEGKKALDCIIDIKGIQEFSHLKVEGNMLSIGAAVTLNQIASFPVVRQRMPFLSEGCHSVGSLQIRNRGTLAGNICNGSPAADTATPLLVLDALVEIIGKEGVKTISIKEFFVGPGLTILGKGEFVSRVLIPIPEEGTKGFFIKHSRRSRVDLSSVNIAVAAYPDGKVRIALGAVAPTPIRSYEGEEYLEGKELNENTINEGVEIIARGIKPISDVRASKEYRLEMVKMHLIEAFTKLMKRNRRRGEM